jgi:multimeric flavodoxin WrbA
LEEEKMIKILGLCCSPKKGATEYLIKEALSSISNIADVETDLISLSGKKIEPCNDCGSCKKNKSWCVIDDDMTELLQRFIEADAFIIGSPVHVYSASPQLYAFFSRMRPLHHVFPGILRNKFGVALAVGGTRNGGQEATVNAIINLMLARGINVVSNEVGGYAGVYLWSKDMREMGAAEDKLALENSRKLSNKLVEIVLAYDYGKKALEEKAL